MAKKNSIAAGGLYARLTEQSETVLIDLLSQEHFAGRHIPVYDARHVHAVGLMRQLDPSLPRKFAERSITEVFGQ